jgi:hypothetical protein
LAILRGVLADTPTLPERRDQGRIATSASTAPGTTPENSGREDKTLRAPVVNLAEELASVSSLVEAEFEAAYPGEEAGDAKRLAPHAAPDVWEGSVQGTLQNLRIRSDIGWSRPIPSIGLREWTASNPEGAARS